MHNPLSDTTAVFPLSLAQPGDTVLVVRHRSGRSVEKKLTTLGVNVNSRVEIIDRQGDGMILGRDGSRFALGFGIAQKIMVTKLDIETA